MVKTDLSRTPAPGELAEITEEERRQAEAEEYLRDHPPRTRQMTEEEAQAERQATLAQIPHALGKPIPEVTGITEEQIRNNPSNYKPAIDDTIAAFSPGLSAETIEMGIHIASDQEITQINNSIVKPAPKAAAPVVDDRQQWVCVQGDGIRTITDGVKHPVFGSDAHLMDQLVRCPQCNSISVRKLLPGEDADHIVPHP